MDPPGAIQEGDIILKTHNTDIDVYREIVRKYSHASNEAAKERNISDYVRMGSTWTLPFTVLRNGQALDVTVKSYYVADVDQARIDEDLLIGKWKILPGNIGYVNMGILLKTDADAAMADLMNTRAIIFDLRNNAKSTQYLIGKYLYPEPVDFVKVAIPDLGYPGEFPFAATYQIGSDNPNYYKGRVVLLFDEFTQSHGEFVCMALQTAPDATLIGSQTAGADGNYSRCWLPGYINFQFSGVGVYYPDGSPAQRIGIVPDIYIRPSILGIQSGRDEVLERAIQFIENNR
jgi:C-terminal processing protease CtpA/Prc